MNAVWTDPHPRGAQGLLGGKGKAQIKKQRSHRAVSAVTKKLTRRTMSWGVMSRVARDALSEEGTVARKVASKEKTWATAL